MLAAVKKVTESAASISPGTTKSSRSEILGFPSEKSSGRPESIAKLFGEWRKRSSTRSPTSFKKRLRLERCGQLKHWAAGRLWERIHFTDKKLITVEQVHKQPKLQKLDRRISRHVSHCECRQNPANFALKAKLPSFSWINGS